MKTFKNYMNEMFADTKEFTDDNEILRVAIQAELDAINFYEQLSKKAKNKSVKNMLLDIAYEEKVHVEEFESLLYELDDEVEEANDDAYEEIEDKDLM